MKKFIKYITICLILFQTTAVFAETVENISISKNADSSVIVSGNLSGGKINVPLILTVTHGERLIAVEQTTVLKTENGKAYFEFNPIKFPYDAPSGYYSYTVEGRFIDEKKTITADSMTVSSNDFYSYITKLNELISAGSADEVYDYVINNGSYLDIDTSYLSSLNKGVSVFRHLMMDKQYACSSEDYVSIENARKEFKQRYEELIAISLFYEIDSAGSYSDWLKAYAEDFLSSENDGELYSYYGRITDNALCAQKISAMNSRRLDAKQFGSFAEEKEQVKKSFYQAVLLTVIQKENAAVAKNIVTSFPDYFNTDNSYYDTLSEQKKGEVFGYIKGVSYDDCSAVCSDFLKYSKQLYQSSPNNGGGGGGGSSQPSGGFWGKENGYPSVSANTASASGETTESDSRSGFTDIEEVDWAKDAINALMKSNIISGRTEQIFAPLENVTRAEFVKMIVLAVSAELIPAEEQCFADVDSGAWYADVVNTAKIKGLIQGDDNNCFLPDSFITRQDMAVIAARAVGFESGYGIYAPFGDIDRIDNYALEYVVYLYKKNVITGNGAGLFCPLDNTTRAEAAVLIHRLLNGI